MTCRQLGNNATYDTEKKNPTSHDVADTTAVSGRRVGKTRNHVIKINCRRHLKKRHFQLRRLRHAKVGFCVFGTHKSAHLGKCGVGVVICIVCYCVCVVLGLGHAKVGFCVIGRQKSKLLCISGVGVGICIVCHCVFVLPTEQELIPEY